MWWLFHVLHSSEGNGCPVGNGCCEGPLVIYTAALTQEWAAQAPSGPATPHPMANPDGGMDLLRLGWGR